MRFLYRFCNTVEVGCRNIVWLEEYRYINTVLIIKRGGVNNGTQKIRGRNCSKCWRY